MNDLPEPLSRAPFVLPAAGQGAAAGACAGRPVASNAGRAAGWRRVLARLGALPVTLAGFGLLVLGLLAWRIDVRVPQAAVVVPLALLALNLAAAMTCRPALRRGGLGLLHAALLVLLLLAGWGRLNHFDAHVEVATGTPLDTGMLQIDSRGPLHELDAGALLFEQGPIRIDYAPGLNRGRTHSTVLPLDAGGGRHAALEVGDDQPLRLGPYRLYTSPNKGHAVLLEWQVEGMAQPIVGALHFPSYPLLDWRQQNEWTAPDGQVWRFSLLPDQPVPMDQAWTFAPDQTGAALRVAGVGEPQLLRPGETLQRGAVRLRYLRLTGWMGYRLFHDPTLDLLLWVALAGVAGLGWHLRHVHRRLGMSPLAASPLPNPSPPRGEGPDNRRVYRRFGMPPLAPLGRGAGGEGSLGRQVGVVCAASPLPDPSPKGRGAPCQVGPGLDDKKDLAARGRT